MACGELCSLFLDAKGALYSCGSGETLQLGNGDSSDQAWPRPVPNVTSVAAVTT